MEETKFKGNKDELNIQWSSISLGTNNENPVAVAGTLLTGLLGKEKYTKTVFEKAQKFEKETRLHCSSAAHGENEPATMIDTEELRDFKELLIKGSIDLPYIIDWFKLPSEKAKEVISRRGIGLQGILEYGFEIAYAMMQARGKEDFKKSVTDVLDSFPKQSPVTMRTCIKNASNKDVLVVMKDLVKNNPNIQFALEPNPKLVNTLPEYIKYIDQLRSFNPDLNIGLDLDLTHLKDENRSLLNILNRLEGSKHFPMIVSLGGKVLSNDINPEMSAHVPLNLQDSETVKNLGQYYSTLRFRNQELPSFVFEQSPVEQGLFENYLEFLKSFKKGYHPN